MEENNCCKIKSGAYTLDKKAKLKKNQPRTLENFGPLTYSLSDFYKGHLHSTFSFASSRGIAKFFEVLQRNLTNPLRYCKNSGFLMFSGGIERDQWYEIG